MTNNKKLMGIDFGERRIGIALSDTSQKFSSGFRTIDTEKDPNFLATIGTIIEEENVEKVVVGYPLRTDGKTGGKVEVVDDFIRDLKKDLNLPLVRVDESYSSERAKKIIQMRTPNRKKKNWFDKEEIDRTAAAVILQDYIDHGEEI